MPDNRVVRRRFADDQRTHPGKLSRFSQCAGPVAARFFAAGEQHHYPATGKNGLLFANAGDGKRRDCRLHIARSASVQSILFDLTERIVVPCGTAGEPYRDGR